MISFFKNTVTTNSTCHPTKCQDWHRRAPRGTALLTPHDGARRGRVISAMLQPPYPWERALAPTVDEGQWVHGQVWTDKGKTKSLASTRVQTLDCMAHNKLQYQLHYRAIHFKYPLT